MSLQLAPDQVRRLVERANRERRGGDDDEGEAPCYRLPAGGAADGGLDPLRKRRHTSYLLFLEGTDPSPDTPFWTRVLDSMVQGFQPEPALTHVELFIPPDGLADDVHFSTYLASGQTGVGVPGRRRVLPRQEPAAVARRADHGHGRRARRGASSRRIARRPTARARRCAATPSPCRRAAAAGLLSDTPKVTPAHCASLAARCLKPGCRSWGCPTPSLGTGRRRCTWR